MSRRRRLIRPRQRDLKAAVKQVRRTSSVSNGKLKGVKIRQKKIGWL